jgi:hypothetical protein
MPSHQFAAILGNAAHDLVLWDLEDRQAILPNLAAMSLPKRRGNMLHLL